MSSLSDSLSPDKAPWKTVKNFSTSSTKQGNLGGKKTINKEI